MKKYSIQSYGDGAGQNTMADSASELLDAVCHGLQWGDKVVIQEINDPDPANLTKPMTRTSND